MASIVMISESLLHKTTARDGLKPENRARSGHIAEPEMYQFKNLRQTPMLWTFW